MPTSVVNNFCKWSYIHISTLSRFRMSAIWWAPYLAVRNFSRSFSQTGLILKLTVLFGVPGGCAFGRDVQVLVFCCIYCKYYRWLWRLPPFLLSKWAVGLKKNLLHSQLHQIIDLTWITWTTLCLGLKTARMIWMRMWKVQRIFHHGWKSEIKLL